MNKKPETILVAARGVIFRTMHFLVTTNHKTTFFDTPRIRVR